MESADDAVSDFLKSQAAEGERIPGSGRFTLAREKALEKLAEFQLPFEGAWALKVVQAAVAGAKTSQIQVQLRRKESVFSFSPPAEWTAEVIEGVFFNPNSTRVRGLDHLRRALWVLALSSKVPWQFQLPGDSTLYCWSDKEFKKEACPPSEEFRLTVKVPQDRHGGRARWDADIAEALTEQAYTCPVPLTLDGRRLDALQHCPYQGMGATSHPIALGWAGGGVGLGRISIPPATFVVAGNKEQQKKVRKLRSLSADLTPPTRKTGEEKIFYMLTIHADWVQVATGRAFSREISPLERSCEVVWVRDGVVVDRERLGTWSDYLTVSVWASAEGLESDMSTFALRQTQEKRKRCQSVTKALNQALTDIPEPTLEGLQREGRLQSRLKGGGLALLGLTGVASGNPVMVMKGVSLMIGGALFSTMGEETLSRQTRLVFDDLRKSIKLLANSSEEPHCRG